MSIKRAFDGLGILVGVFGTLYCSVQWFRGVPVEPTWFWGVMAYMSWANRYMGRWDDPS